MQRALMLCGGEVPMLDLWTPYSPSRDNVIVIPVADETQRVTAGGVHLAQDATLEDCEGIITAVGPGVQYDLPKAVAERFLRNVTETSRPMIASWLENACTPIPPPYNIGDRVFFLPWKAQWQVHDGDRAVRYACFSAKMICGVRRGEAIEPPEGAYFVKRIEPATKRGVFDLPQDQDETFGVLYGTILKASGLFYAVGDSIAYHLPLDSRSYGYDIIRDEDILGQLT